MTNRQPITLNQFNYIYESDRFLKLKGKGYYRRWIKLTKSKVVKKGDKEWVFDELGVRLIVHSDNVTKQVFCTKSFNELIVRYLKLFTPAIKVAITDTKGVFNPRTGKFMQNKADKGRADITAQYKDFELGVETKQRYETQKDSQKEFQAMTELQSFRKYVLVRSFEDFQLKMFEIFPNLPTAENWMTFVHCTDPVFLNDNKRLLK